MFLTIIIFTCGVVLYMQQPSYMVIKTSCHIPQLFIDNSIGGIAYLKSKKTHNIAVILGTGVSVASIDYNKWIQITSMSDTWGMNQIFFHDYIIPKFYHLEMASVRSHKNNELWSYFNTKRRHLYINTTFITSEFNQHAVHSMLCKNSSFIPSALITYTTTDSLWDRRGCTIKKLKSITRATAYASIHKINGYCAATITRLIGIVLKMNYRHIAFIGVELNTHIHFYTYHNYIISNNITYEYNILNKDRRLYHSNLHATGSRGVHLFIDRIASIYSNITFYNLENSGLVKYYV